MPTVIIHIIDDDADDREILSEILHQIDHDLVLDESSDCEEAWNRLQGLNAKPNAILLDLNLPKINGNEFLSMLKGDDRLKNIPVYIYSTASGEKEKKQASIMGAENFISKTSDLRDLKEKLTLLVDELKDRR